MMKANRQPSVLVVEDEKIVAKDLQQTLRDMGYDAFAIASSADEAILRASERCPDLVLMDIRIDGRVNGIEAAEILKARFGVPIVYLTAHADEGTLARAKKTEPQGYLVKPVKSAELRSVVEIALYKHEMEKRLRERERWFSTTLRSIADAVIAVDLSGNVTFMNAAAETLTGTSLAASKGKPVGQILQLVDGRPDDELPILKAMREGHSVELKESALRNLTSGALRIVSDIAAPVTDDAETLGAVMVFRDVTEEKKVRKQLELADRLASLGTMAAGVAHEVNNPLAVVVGNSAFLSEELSALRSMAVEAPDASERIERMQQALSDVQSAATRITRIVSDLRVFSQPTPPASGNVDVRGCIEWAIRTTSHQLKHRAKVVTRLETVPSVKADEAKLGQVFINLLVNAAQAISPGNAEANQVTIEARVGRDGRVVVEVRDTGEGIPKDALDRLFEPFFTTKAPGAGTGLGLSICQGIVRSLGGEIRVESEVGRGTMIQVLLPAAPSEQAAVEPAKRSGTRRGRILVIDDEAIMLRLMLRVLEGHEVCCVASAKEALTLIEQGQRFDIILSDVMMPNMTGIELYEELLRSAPDLARRVVFLSGGAMTEHIDNFLQTVSNLRIDKPFDVLKLKETIQELLASGA